MNKAFLIVLFCGVIACSADAKWALVIDDSVTETWDKRPKFHADVMKDVKSVGDEVEPGWRKIGSAYYPPKTQEEKEQDSFNVKRARLISGGSREARKRMAAEWRYKLAGDLATGYPDVTQPLCQTPEGEVLTLDEFMEYIQERDDDDAAAQELKNLKSIAKGVRKYFRTLKP